jgi:hypothetical protein
MAGVPTVCRHLLCEATISVCSVVSKAYAEFKKPLQMAKRKIRLIIIILTLGTIG